MSVVIVPIRLSIDFILNCKLNRLGICELRIIIVYVIGGNHKTPFFMRGVRWALIGGVRIIPLTVSRSIVNSYSFWVAQVAYFDIAAESNVSKLVNI
ncbi:hypothetical protein D3C84_1062170 [compost metagenome]